MESTNIIVSELKGSVNANPEILSSYPSIETTVNHDKELLHKCFPFGAKIGEFHEDRFGRKRILSYIFNIPHQENRDDLLSLSLILTKRTNIDILKLVLNELIELLIQNELLNQKVITTCLPQIFEGINNEKAINIEDLTINFTEMFDKIRTKLNKPKRELRGSFY